MKRKTKRYLENCCCKYCWALTAPFDCACLVIKLDASPDRYLFKYYSGFIHLKLLDKKKLYKKLCTYVTKFFKSAELTPLISSEILGSAAGASKLFTDGAGSFNGSKNTMKF